MKPQVARLPAVVEKHLPAGKAALPTTPSFAGANRNAVATALIVSCAAERRCYMYYLVIWGKLASQEDCPAGAKTEGPKAFAHLLDPAPPAPSSAIL